MDNQTLRGNKPVYTSIEKPDELASYANALSSPARIDIIRLLNEGPMGVNELAERLSLPMSTTALHVRKLEKAGIISTAVQPGTRGAVKLSTRRIDNINISLYTEDHFEDSVLTLEIPVGSYSLLGDNTPTCGLASAYGAIGIEDQLSTFYLPDHTTAQLLWFHTGYVEYHVSATHLSRIHVKWLELSFEACSEAPMYRDPWKSDISVSINDRLLGTWTSPCDCGNHRGKLNPDWWPNTSTQFGFLKSFRVDQQGSFLDGEPLSDVTISELRVQDKPYISLRIAVPEDAVNAGGLNLFGKQFGDFPQGIVLRIGYSVD